MCIYITPVCKKKKLIYFKKIQPRNAVFPKLVNTLYSVLVYIHIYKFHIILNDITKQYYLRKIILFFFFYD